jgi:hypothetical protein
MNAVKITARWTTIQTTGFSGCVCPNDCNGRAHGNTTDLQVRRTRTGSLIARQVNNNAGVQEAGNPFPYNAK